MTFPSDPRLYTSPFFNKSKNSCIPSFSFSLALSTSAPTKRSSASSLPVRIALCNVRAVETGTTEASKDTDGDAAALYDEAKRVALNLDIDGFSC